MSVYTSPEARPKVLSVLRLLRPMTVLGVEKVRLGRMHDGGYVMLNAFSQVQAAYSFGINDDVSWDLDIARKGIPLFQYDHTIEALPESHPLFRWEQTGISDGDASYDGLMTIDDLIKKNGHDDYENIILKCDIEGYEWGALRHVSRRTLEKFSQIVLELHWLHMLGEPENINNIESTLLNVMATHSVAHVHANNYTGFNTISGFPVPETLELTFAIKNRWPATPSDESFPTALDQPCNPSAADLFLGRFDFA